MTPDHRLAGLRAGVFAACLACLAAGSLTGCGKKSQPAGPVGESGGDHLVAFATDRGRAAGDYALALYDLDAGGFHSLANLDAAGSESEPCVSDDGNFVSFAATRGSSTGSDLYIYDRLNQVLLPTPGLNTVRDETWPRFTYDSVHLAFVTRLAATGETRVRLYEPLGDTLIPLPGLDALASQNDDMPAPNLDGSRIAFVSDRSGTHDVWVWNRGPGAATRAGLASPGDDIEPSLSSNGRWLAFASNRTGGAGGYDVYLYDLVGDSLVALPGANAAGDDRHPTVNADGSVLVYQSDRAGGGGQHDLYRYTRAGAVLDQPAAFKDASDDIQPYLRWR